ncbi:MAG: NAD-dependent epimerase/dehydratase family protein [Elusimicrobia bacterium]|nr:NAD-dependent epimerase/dehydratase family protein [Elusimicrobiota bacterium]
MRGRTLITGGDGMLGRALRRFLPGALHVVRKDCDLTDGAAVERLFARIRPGRVVHLAAAVGGVRRNAASNVELFEENVLINAHVLCAARRHGASRLIAVLSSCAYPLGARRPPRELDLHLGMPFGGNLGYGYSKRMLEVHARLVREQFGLRFTTVTPVTMYGPHDDWDPDSGHVVAALMAKAARAKKEGGPLLVWGSGRAVRQFVFVEDVARLLAMFSNRGGPDNLIIAPDAGITIRELARKVAGAVGFCGPIMFDPDRPEGQARRVLCGSAFTRCCPGFAFTSLDEGLARTARWYLGRRGAPPAGAQTA